MRRPVLHFCRYISTQPRLRLPLLILIGLYSVLIAGLLHPLPVHAAVVNCADTTTTGVPQAECETLVAFYTSTNGPGWLNKTNWNTATNVDTWYGVTTDTEHVTHLSLNNNQLSGSIPGLSALTQLSYLSLINNQLSGNIPDLSGLIQLDRLNLSYNQLSGAIPDLSALTQLRYLYLSNNQLNGSIPDLSALTQLWQLQLDDNQLGRSIPDLSALTQLQWLNLIWCLPRA
jgi:Leucine-rich repeat (LRR) protein